MFGTRKVKSILINANLVDITNEKTGEVSHLTKFTYAVSKSNNDYSVGGALLECYRSGNLLEKVNARTMKECILEIEEKPTKNGSKYILRKIDNLEL